MTLDTFSPQTEVLSIEQILHQAVALHQAGEVQEAEKLYRAILQIEPGHAKANHNLGVLYVQMKQPAAALAYLMAALEADPAHGQYWLSYIDALYQADQLEAARQVLALARKQGLQGAEVDALVQQLEGSQTQEAPQSSQATPPVKSSGQGTHGHGKAPSSQEANALVALFTQGSYAEAARLAQGMTQHFPHYGFGWKVLGAALKQMGRNAEALMPLQKAAELLPNDAEALSNLGANFQDLGRSAEAEASLRRALQIDPGNAQAHTNLGFALHSLGQLEQAEASYRRALQIKPDYAEAYSNLGLVLHDTGRQAEAEACYRRALQIKPDFAEAYSNLGITLQNIGKLNEAEASCRRALQINPDLASAHSNLGITLQSLGRLDEALIHFQHRARLTPGDKVAEYQIASLTGENAERAPVQYVENLFDNYADKFDAHLQQVLEYDIPEKLAALVKRHSPNAGQWRVLDLGCGTGLVGSVISPLAEQLVGVDLSAKMLEKAQARKLYDRLERLDLLTMMQNEAASSYDLIIAADVFIYLGRIDEIMGEIKRLLRPGGVFAFSVEDVEVLPGKSEIHDIEQGYRLKNTGRYAHSNSYLARLASSNSFLVEEMASTRIRIEHGKPVGGHIALWRG
jgi:predicted TPR repeat methyltransferase